jgi:aspartate carbamoyltransferase catalytic subunit
VVPTVAGKRALRHVNSINDLQDSELSAIFSVAERYLKALADKDAPHTIRSSTDVAKGKILATVFLEPSTRTRLSFESAMHRLGGSVITSADAATSSTAKGESLADTVRVVSNYADIIVLRHPRDGAARHAAEYASIPVINAGDGSHEHPTQTLCDLFTLLREHKDLKGLNVAISGDLRGSRTIHSFVYALARMKANLVLMPAKGMELPPHVDARLREEFGLRLVPKSSHEEDAAIDALYVTPEEPHQQSLFPSSDAGLTSSITNQLDEVDVVYVTRFQKERWTAAAQSYTKVDKEFLDAPKYKKSSVLHPLPRVGELDVALDDDKRAAYFRQASLGVPVRMALISLLLGLEDAGRMARYETGFRAEHHGLYEQPHDTGMSCTNPNCITHDPLERPHTRNRFFYLDETQPTLRCFYCDHDVRNFVFGSRKSGRYFEPDAKAKVASLGDLVAFADAAAAAGAGFEAPSERKRARAG